MAHGLVDEVSYGLTGVDHESVGELHGLGTSSTQLTRDDDLATLGTSLHNESQNTVGGTSDGQTTEELVAEGLALGNGVQSTVLYLLGVELEGTLGETESLLDQSSQLTDSATLVTENILGVGGSDDDLSSGVGDTDLTARVSLLGELSGEELVELGSEDSVSYELWEWRSRGCEGEDVRQMFPRRWHLLYGALPPVPPVLLRCWSARQAQPRSRALPLGAARYWKARCSALAVADLT